MRKLYTFLFCLLATVAVRGAEPYDFIVDGLYYSIVDASARTVAVCNPNTSDTKYTADTIVVPSTVSHDSQSWTVTQVASRTFYSVSCKYISLPNTVRVICSNAFALNSKLEYLNLGTGVEVLQSNALGSMSKITNFRLPPNVRVLAEQAVSLTMDSVFIPASVVDMDPRAFYNCSKTSKYIVDPANTVYKSVDGDVLSKDGTAFLMHPRYSTATSVTLPETVTVIGPYACYGNTNLTAPLEIPERIKTVGTWAFASCRKITGVKTGGAVDIGPFAFAWVSYDTSLEIGPALRTIGANAFESFGSSAYKTIDSTLFIPATVQHIGTDAFTSSSFPRLEIAEGREVIDTMAFAGMPYLVSIKLPSTLKRIDMLAFRVASRLTAINLPASVTYIGDGAFIGANYVTSVEISPAVEYIGRRAFAQCVRLTAINVSPSNPYFASRDGILFSKDFRTLKTYPGGLQATEYTIPAGVTTLEGGAFGSNSYIKTVEVPAGVTTLGVGVWQQCSALQTVTLPEGITELPEATFLQCTNLQNPTLPHGLKSIGKQAFAYCTNITAITFPSAVSSIGEQAFLAQDYPTYMQTKLTAVTVHSRTPCPIAQNAFMTKTYNGTLYVPTGCVDAYKAAEGWKNFKTILEDPTAVQTVADATESIRVFAASGSIVIAGADGLPAEVYTLSGQKVYAGTDARIDGLPAGAYIVRIASKAYKVIL